METLISSLKDSHIQDEPHVPDHDQTLDNKIPKYVYEELEDDNKIRVVHLLCTKDQIECSIRQIPWSEGGYQALSYVWGSEDRPFRAIILDNDGKSLGYIPLTLNLRNALCDLYQTDDTSGKIFWIDQICINQQGKEKGHQVALMNQIFKTATRVITYLGPGQSETEERRGIQLLQDLNDHFSLNCQYLTNCIGMNDVIRMIDLFPIKTPPRNLEYDADKGIENYTTQGWKWLLEVLFGQWTSRLWIVQEQLLNFNIIMLRGHQLISWDSVTVLTAWFCLKFLPPEYVERFWQEQQSSSTNPERLPTDPWEVCGSVFVIWRKRREMTALTSLDTGPLLYNMTHYASHKCHDHRDHVFALLAISSDSEILGILPEYSESNTAEDVFWKTSVQMLKSYPRLAAFATVKESVYSENANIPSWVSTFPWLDESGPPSLPYDTFVPHPQITLSSPPVFGDGDKTVTLKGRIVDRICFNIQIPRFSHGASINDIWARRMLQTLSALASVLSQAGLSLKNTASLCLATAPSLFMPDDPLNHDRSRPYPHTLAKEFSEFYNINLNMAKGALQTSSIDMTEDIQICERFIQRLDTFQQPRINVAEVIFDRDERDPLGYIDNNQLYNARAFCITEEKRIANAVGQVAEGDVVVIFRGADRPYILRQVEDKFKLIGDVYIDGIMFAEAYKDVDPDDVDQDIELI
jgi:Heterokaryon incompatibility protein (HET)